MVREYDRPLQHNLSNIDNFIIFGVLKFNSNLSAERIMALWYIFIRGVEIRDKGEWFVGVEGDNVVRQRHLHYALGVGMLKDSYSELAALIEAWIDYLKLKHPEFRSGSSYFTEYSNDKGGDWYLSKLSNVELVSQRGIGLDSVGNSNWKMSTELKKSIKAKNENARHIEDEILQGNAINY